MDKISVQRGFVEIDDLSKGCKFRNCNHDYNSVGCNVVAAYDKGTLSESRLLNYKKLMDTIIE